MLHHLRELRIFTEKSVSGMDGVGAGHLGGGEDGGDVQVALLGRRRADAERLVGELHVQRVRVRGGVDRHGLDAQLAGRPDDAEGDLGPVRDEDLVEHLGAAAPGCAAGTAWTAVTGAGGWPMRSVSLSWPSVQSSLVTSVPCKAARIALSFSTSMPPRSADAGEVLPVAGVDLEHVSLVDE